MHLWKENKNMNYCCKTFAEQVQRGQFGSNAFCGWYIYGCCGGHCYVVTNMKCCPYCGKRLPKIKLIPEERIKPQESKLHQLLDEII